MKTTVNRSYYLVKYADGCYMGSEHPTLNSAMLHIKALKEYPEPEYKNRTYTISQFIEIETIIE